MKSKESLTHAFKKEGYRVRSSWLGKDGLCNMRIECGSQNKCGIHFRCECAARAGVHHRMYTGVHHRMYTRRMLC
jgi:hypothetical protein